jgi:uncharacterized RDD family membrane protein YckC
VTDSNNDLSQYFPKIKDGAKAADAPIDIPVEKPTPRVGLEAHIKSPISNVQQPEQDDNWESHPPRPWRRYFARMLDCTIFGLLGWLLIGSVITQFAPYSFNKFAIDINPLLDTFLTFLVGSIISGFILGFVGTTVGKAIFGIKVTLPNGKPIGAGAGVLRDLKVWLWGCAMGIPLIYLITVIISYNNLRDEKSTAWDRGRFDVQYRKSGAGQTILNIFGVALLIVFVFSIKALEHL